MLDESVLIDSQHVRSEIKDYLEIDGRQRLYRCWDKIWIQTPSSKEAFVALTDCMNAAPSSKPRGLVITGEADTGKSRTMQAFRDAYPPSIDAGTEFAEHPVIYIKAPDKPSRTAIYKSILADLGHPILYSASEEDLRRHTVNMIKGCRVGTIMIDEMHDISRERLSNQTVEFLRSIKSLVNETERPFVVGGVPVVLDLMSSDDQIAGRFNTVVRLEPFKITDFVKIALAFERMLPLRRPSNLRSCEAAVQFLFSHSQGFIGRLSYLLHDACQIAIESGEERITPEILQRVPDRTIRTATSRD